MTSEVSSPLDNHRIRAGAIRVGPPPGLISTPAPVPTVTIPIGGPLPPKGTSGGNTLRRHSLLGAADELERLAQEQTPLLGGVCLRGQTTVWYARPNTGKTLIALHLTTEAVKGERIAGDDVFYVAADDNSAGVIEKLRLLEPLGVHVLAPGFNGFEPRDLPARLNEMIASSSVGGSFLILDTLKKFCQLMSKQESSGFADVARRFVMKGGTVLGLAHTNKRPGSDGKPIFAGTSDILEDFDCAFILDELAAQTTATERVVQFSCIKSRGAVAQQEAYRYGLDRAPYADIIRSVRQVGAEEASEFAEEAERLKDAPIIEAIEDAIHEGTTAKMDIVREAGRKAKIGRHVVTAVIDRYAGDDPALHRWKFTVVGHGKQVFQLHNPPTRLPKVDPNDTF